MDNIKIKLLSRHSELVSKIASWLEAEWPSWYGPVGNGNAEIDVRAYSDSGSLPIGLVAYCDDEPCGFAGLKTDAIMSYEHLSPWVGAGFVQPHFRNRGIGSKLLYSLELKAKKLGYSQIYCGTSKAINLIKRSGWKELGEVYHNGDMIKVYEKAL